MHTAAISRKEERYPNDPYYTPKRLTQELLSRVDIRGNVCEPCAGEGAIASVLLEHGCAVCTNDIIPGLMNDHTFNASNRSAWEVFNLPPRIHWTVTNPPFSHAAKILPLAWEYSAVGVAFLLRTSYVTEPCKNRAEWLKENSRQMKHFIVFNPRPRFRSDRKGTDSCTVGWAVWVKDWDKGLTNGIEYVNDWHISQIP